MRLLDTKTLKLREFIGSDIPEYAILSHTWEKEEVSFQDYPKPDSRKLAGFSKISRCCALAASEGWQYVWIDTCCIDKSSSAELSEAINSMYRWYAEAQVCYVYMADISVVRNKENPLSFKNRTFAESRWFTRGWTLQELLAPRSVSFYDSNWTNFGLRASLEDELEAATRISKHNFQRPRDASIAAKMSWASFRETTRIEDVAYCLLGLFDVNMPLLYGEGNKAFKRLQHEIIRSTDDESIFAWSNRYAFVSGMFANSPDDFANSGDIIPILLKPRRNPYTVTNRGLAFETPIRYGHGDDEQAKRDGIEFPECRAPLACATQSDQFLPFVVVLEGRGEGAVRRNPQRLEKLNAEMASRKIHGEPRTYYVRDITISSQEHKILPDQEQLPIIINFTPAATRYFQSEYRVLRSGQAEDQPLNLNNGSILINQGLYRGESISIGLSARDSGHDLVLCLIAPQNERSKNYDVAFYPRIVKPGQGIREIWESIQDFDWKRNGHQMMRAIERDKFLWIDLNFGQRIKDPVDWENPRSKDWLVNIDINNIDRSKIRNHHMEQVANTKPP